MTKIKKLYERVVGMCEARKLCQVSGVPWSLPTFSVRKGREPYHVLMSLAIIIPY